MPPPDAAEAPGKGPQQITDKSNHQHRSDRCLTCGGRAPYNEGRRLQQELEAVMRGDKRICDLPDMRVPAEPGAVMAVSR